MNFNILSSILQRPHKECPNNFKPFKVYVNTPCHGQNNKPDWTRYSVIQECCPFWSMQFETDMILLISINIFNISTCGKSKQWNILFVFVCGQVNSLSFSKFMKTVFRITYLYASFLRQKIEYLIIYYKHILFILLTSHFWYLKAHVV